MRTNWTSRSLARDPRRSSATTMPVAIDRPMAISAARPCISEAASSIGTHSAMDGTRPIRRVKTAAVAPIAEISDPRFG